MSKPLQIRFLELLEENGIANGTPIGKFMDDNFHHPGDNLEDAVREKDRAHNFIWSLYQRKLIFLDRELYANLWGWSDYNQCITWFTEIEIAPSITTEGIDYLTTYRLNAAMLISNKLSRKSFIATVILSAVTLGVTIATLVITESTSDVLQRVEVRLRHLELSHQWLISQEDHKPSPVEKSRKR